MLTSGLESQDFSPLFLLSAATQLLSLLYWVLYLVSLLLSAACIINRWLVGALRLHFHVVYLLGVSGNN